MFAGEAINVTEGRAVEHTALRGVGRESSVEEAHALHLRVGGRGVERGDVDETRRQAGDLVRDGAEAGKKLLDFEVADGIAAIESAQVQGHVGSLRCVDPGGGRSGDFTRAARPVIATDTLRRRGRWDNLRP